MQPCVVLKSSTLVFESGVELNYIQSSAANDSLPKLGAHDTTGGSLFNEIATSQHGGQLAAQCVSCCAVWACLRSQ